MEEMVDQVVAVEWIRMEMEVLERLIRAMMVVMVPETIPGAVVVLQKLEKLPEVLMEQTEVMGLLLPLQHHLLLEPEAVGLVPQHKDLVEVVVEEMVEIIVPNRKMVQPIQAVGLAVNVEIHLTGRVETEELAVQAWVF